jgi:hypothetical protein
LDFILDFILLYIALVLFILCIWKFLPRGLLLFWPNPQLRLINSKNKLFYPPQDQEVQNLFDIIKSLGFTKLGASSEKLPLWSDVKSIHLISNSEPIIATISVIHKKVIFFFETPFSDGRIVLTANSAFPAIGNDQILQSSIGSLSIEDLLAIHRKQVESFSLKGAQPYSEYDQDILSKSCKQYYNIKIIRKFTRSNGLTYLLITIFTTYLFAYAIIQLVK